MIDAAGKARHCVLMLIAAPVLAGNAPDPAQERALARYAFLWADSFLEWARRWRNQLAQSRDRETSQHTFSMKPELAEFATLLDGVAGVRDYLVAKRQPLAPGRADDMDATALVWLRVNSQVVNSLWVAAIRLYDGLARAAPDDSIMQFMGLPFDVQSRVRAALPTREPYWYLAADTGADCRPNTLPAAQGGELGRVIAQINDVALHLDALLRLAPVLYGRLPYDWLIRSCILLELAALLDLTIGNPPQSKPHGRPTLIEMCHYGRPKDAAEELERLRDSIPLEIRAYVRWCRDKFAAHLDRELSLLQIHGHLAELDYHGVIALAEDVLDWLDALGAANLDLRMLALGERRIASWPLDPDHPDRVPAPNSATIPGALADLFRRIDSPYISATASSMGSAILAGITAGRRPKPRDKVSVPPRVNNYLEPVPVRLHVRS